MDFSFKDGSDHLQSSPREPNSPNSANSPNSSNSPNSPNSQNSLNSLNSHNSLKLKVGHPLLCYGGSLNGLSITDHYRQKERFHVFQTAVSAFISEAMTNRERRNINHGAGRDRGGPPLLTSQAYHPTTVPMLLPAPAPSALPPWASQVNKHYCCSPVGRSAIFCGLRKSLREILSSKHTSSMYSLVPMMYSQADLFYSPRSKRKDGDEDTGGSAVTPGVSSAWKGLKIELAPNPKAHLHFNSAVRQAVENYSDVLSSMKCHHMNDIITEVMRLCPLLRNEVTVKNKVRRAVKSYICNAVTHFKRKQRNKALCRSASRVHAPDHSGAHSTDDVGELFGEASSSYQDELIDYSKAGHAHGYGGSVAGAVGSASAQEKAIVYAQSHAPSSTINRHLSISSVDTNPQTDDAFDSDQQLQQASAIVKSELGPDQLLKITEVRSLDMDGDQDGEDCVASSGENNEKEFRFSDGPSMEELRAVQADFAKQRDWDQFHQPRNLLLAMIGEVGEVSELFQWRGECKEGLEGWSEKDKKHLGQELSDVLMYLIRLAEKCHVDLPRAAFEKVGINAKKYPAQKVYD